MNLHPVFVHFPIALLSIYCLLEFIRSKKLRGNDSWFYMKLSLLLIGTVFGFITIQTGDIAKHLLGGGRGNPLISLHEFWGKLTVVLFGGLSVLYLVAWIKKLNLGIVSSLTANNTLVGKIWILATKIQHIFTETFLVVVIAAAGLASILITGALGGSIVYGPQADVFTQLIARLILGN